MYSKLHSTSLQLCSRSFHANLTLQEQCMLCYMAYDEYNFYFIQIGFKRTILSCENSFFYSGVFNEHWFVCLLICFWKIHCTLHLFQNFTFSGNVSNRLSMQLKNVHVVFSPAIFWKMNNIIMICLETRSRYIYFNIFFFHHFICLVSWNIFKAHRFQ